jgi:hypothetical protein
MPISALPQADGLYDPRYEHDACGVAMVARLDNRPDHGVIERALTALENLEHVAPHVDFAPGLSHVDRILLADAQTSGGLLIALPEERCEALLSALRDRGVADARRIGRFATPGPGRIRVF